MNVAISKDDFIAVDQKYGSGNVFLFHRNSTGIWALIDKLVGNAWFPKLSGNLLAVVRKKDGKKNAVFVYTVGASGMSTPIKMFTGPIPNLKVNSYDITPDSVVIGEGSDFANVYPMKSGVKLDKIQSSWYMNSGKFSGFFGKNIKMLKKVNIQFVFNRILLLYTNV